MLGIRSLCGPGHSWWWPASGTRRVWSHHEEIDLFSQPAVEHQIEQNSTAMCIASSKAAAGRHWALTSTNHPVELEVHLGHNTVLKNMAACVRGLLGQGGVKTVCTIYGIVEVCSNQSSPAGHLRATSSSCMHMLIEGCHLGRSRLLYPTSFIRADPSIPHIWIRNPKSIPILSIP